MKKLNSQSIVTAKGVYLCMLTVYALLREVLALQEVVGSTLIAYGFFAVGVLLVVALVLCNRKAFLRKSQWLPIAFLIICMLSTIVNYKFDFMSNVKAIAWMALYFMLLLPEIDNTEVEARNRKRIITTAVITVVALALISLPMYFFDVDYTYVKPSGFPNNQGFSRQYMRLWGVFYDANTAAVYSLVGICFAVYLFANTKKMPVRILLGLACVVLFQMVVLTSSRTALVALVAAAAWIGLCFVFSHIRGNTRKRIVVSALAAVIAAGATVGVYEAVKLVLPYEKLAIQSITSTSFQTSIHEAYDTFYENSNLNITDGYYGKEPDGTDPAMSRPVPQKLVMLASGAVVKESSGSVYARMEETKTVAEGLDRTDESDDITNGRLQKWLEVLEVFKEMPILGASPRGISSAAKQINPAGSVAKFGIAAHNSLLEVLAGTGLLGFVIVLAMLVWLVWGILHNMISEEKEKVFFLYSTVLLIIACEMMFISDVFFTLTFGGIVFWLAAGRIFDISPLPEKRSKT